MAVCAAGGVRSEGAGLARGQGGSRVEGAWPVRPVGKGGGRLDTEGRDVTNFLVGQLGQSENEVGLLSRGRTVHCV